MGIFCRKAKDITLIDISTSSKNLKITSNIILTVVRIPESISPNAPNISIELVTER